MKDYYKILGLEKTATDEEIKQAYRKLAHQYHPDKAHGNSDKFKEINEAYQTLSNKEKRAQYDRFGRVFDGQGGSPFGSGGFEFNFGFDPNNLEDLSGIGDLFESFFEGLGVKKRKSYHRGSDVEIIQAITLEEAFRGTEKSFQVKSFLPCQKCGTLGYFKDAGVTECSTCSGRGEIKESRNTFFGNFSQVRTCPKCSGSGQIPNKFCPDCRGAGRIAAKKEMKVQITSGVSDGQLIKLAGAGDAGERGAEPGDLYIRIKIEPHKIFEHRGDDLAIKKEINLLDVLLGAKIEIPTIGGNRIYVEIPANFNLRDRLRVPGEGMTKFGGYGRGDLFIEWEVKTPKKLNARAKKLLEELKGEL